MTFEIGRNRQLIISLMTLFEIGSN